MRVPLPGTTRDGVTKNRSLAREQNEDVVTPEVPIGTPSSTVAKPLWQRSRWLRRERRHVAMPTTILGTHAYLIGDNLNHFRQLLPCLGSGQPRGEVISS